MGHLPGSLVRVGGIRPRPQPRQVAHVQRRVPGDLPAPGGAVGAVRPVVVAGLALLRARMEVLPPALRLAGSGLRLARGGTALGSAAGRPAWPGLLRHDVVPVLSAYVLLMAMMIATRGGRRAREERAAPPAGPGPKAVPWRALARHLVVTALGGYGVFLAIVLVYYLALGGEDARFIRDALTGGAWLGFGIGLPGILVVAWIEDRLGRRH